MDVYEDIESPVGRLRLIASDSALVAIGFEHGRDAARDVGSLTRGSNVIVDRTHTQLAEYFAGSRREFDLPLDYPGSEFQQRVWSTLLAIPYGQTWSYLDVALRIGDAGATRAVGTANGLNEIAIVIPCHRVINANGALGGYGGGLWRKRLLLDLELGQASLAL